MVKGSARLRKKKMKKYGSQKKIRHKPKRRKK